MGERDVTYATSGRRTAPEGRKWMVAAYLAANTGGIVAIVILAVLILLLLYFMFGRGRR